MTTKQDLQEITDKKLSEQKNLTNGPDNNTSLNQISSKKLPQPIKHISSTLTPLLEIYKSLRQEIMDRGQEPKYKIGLKELDEVLWGVHKKQLLVVGARTSHGKSSFAMHIAKNISDTAERRVVYFSLEMSKEQLLERLLTNHCKIDNLDLRHGKAKESFLANEKTFTFYIKNLKLLIDDSNGYDFKRMCDVCEVIRPDFVIIDYIQMVSAKGYRSKLDAIEEYLRGIKQKALDMNFGAIILSQLNRSGTGDEADLQHLKHAGAIEEHPDSVLLVSWNPTEENRYKYTVKVKKQRHGEVGRTIELTFKPQFSYFEDGAPQPIRYK